MLQKDVDPIAKSEDPDQTAPLGVSRSALFAQNYLSEIFGSLGNVWYLPCRQGRPDDIQILLLESRNQLQETSIPVKWR